MKQCGYEFGAAGRSAFAQDYGVLETITKIEPAENACSKAKATTLLHPFQKHLVLEHQNSCYPPIKTNRLQNLLIIAMILERMV